jgi:putative transposase
MVKHHHFAKSISDAAWYQFAQWLEYYGKIRDKAVVSVNPKFTSQDCSNCGHRVKKTLSSDPHVYPSCHIEICCDTNAARNILSRGLEIIGIEYNQGPIEHTGTSRKNLQDEKAWVLMK